MNCMYVFWLPKYIQIFSKLVSKNIAQAQSYRP